MNPLANPFVPSAIAWKAPAANAPNQGRSQAPHPTFTQPALFKNSASDTSVITNPWSPSQKARITARNAQAGLQSSDSISTQPQESHDRTANMTNTSPHSGVKDSQPNTSWIRSEPARPQMAETRKLWMEHINRAMDTLRDNKAWSTTELVQRAQEYLEKHTQYQRPHPCPPSQAPTAPNKAARYDNLHHSFSVPGRDAVLYAEPQTEIGRAQLREIIWTSIPYRLQIQKPQQ
ncbi:hypothetical protein BAUCODRAFT_539058 [Baudoinia panamericana UAMH 10762]|uniref:Uncharacterized protein n=1 Tax=Baudoinia panamericana (strain UAMH 10762) TaxID=717646 RepID=M2N984_BAUPA|nr:uncharacterized protein BAUCODRAFT_539058 [Baudoinia panamericana UAMH 10762]EMC95380.1 hypothetical protein BAUCODRAFT_539058 [Baudoinia panamericana UAMH 10762]